MQGDHTGDRITFNHLTQVPSFLTHDYRFQKDQSAKPSGLLFAANSQMPSDSAVPKATPSLSRRT